MLIEVSLHFQSVVFKDIISFATYIMKYQVCKPEEQNLHYNIKKLKNY